MNKLAGYMLVFVLGFAVCAGVFVIAFGPPENGITMINNPTHPSPEATIKGDGSIAAAAAKVEKSVVNIDTEGKPIVSGTGFPDFFGYGPTREVIPKGQASGVIIRKDGYILTNNHVVKDTSKVFVTLWNKKRYPAEIIGRDPKSDLAVIRIHANNLQAAIFNESNTLKVGDWIIAVGNALGLGTTVTVGVVSATDRGQLEIEGTILEHAIQTDAAINRGNSGGALADLNGTIVGINTAIASTNPGGGSIGIGFAVPSKIAGWVANEIIEKGHVVRPWIGITYLHIDDTIRRELRDLGETTPAVNGGRIETVVPGSPAERAGLTRWDVITKINNKSVKSIRTINDVMKQAKVGDKIELTVWRAKNSKIEKITVKTDEMPSDL